MIKNKENKDKPLILIDRYNNKNVISISTPIYKSKIEKQMHYVENLPRRYTINSKPKQKIKRSFSSNNQKPKNKPNKNKNNIYKNNNIYLDPLDFNYTFKEYYIKPSLLYNSKMSFSDPFSPNKKLNKTLFPFHYDNYLIPCHLKHGTSSFSLKWDQSFENIDYSKVLTSCFEGLIETRHPYNFLSRQACKELLLAKNAFPKVLPLLSILYKYLRLALCQESDEIFKESCEIAQILTALADKDGYPYMKLLLQPLQKRILSKKFREPIYKLLNLFCEIYGEGTFDIIKKMIPTYSPFTAWI